MNTKDLSHCLYLYSVVGALVVLGAAGLIDSTAERGRKSHLAPLSDKRALHYDGIRVVYRPKKCVVVKC